MIRRKWGSENEEEKALRQYTKNPGVESIGADGGTLKDPHQFQQGMKWSGGNKEMCNMGKRKERKDRAMAGTVADPPGLGTKA